MREEGNVHSVTSSSAAVQPLTNKFSARRVSSDSGSEFARIPHENSPARRCSAPLRSLATWSEPLSGGKQGNTVRLKPMPRVIVIANGFWEHKGKFSTSPCEFQILTIVQTSIVVNNRMTVIGFRLGSDRSNIPVARPPLYCLDTGTRKQCPSRTENRGSSV